MALAFRFSASPGPLITGQDAQRATRGIAASGLPTTLAEVPGHPFDAGRLVGHMGQDKKAEGGRLTFILARALGDAFVAKDVDASVVRDFLISEGQTSHDRRPWSLALAPSLLIMLTLSGLLSAAETSMTAASRGRLHQLEREGDPAARRINRCSANQETMIGAILLANNVINIGASALTTSVLSRWPSRKGRWAPSSPRW
jgi:hypothetical protein